MQLIYIHGLDSNHLAEKGQKLRHFCEKKLSTNQGCYPKFKLPTTRSDYVITTTYRPR